jgi:DNA-binding CsgD family transcriptional regulator
VLHAILGVYILCFAGGVTLVVVSVLASRRLAVRGLRDFAVLFGAATLILVVDALKTYERAVGYDFGGGLHVSGIVLSVLGNAGITWYLLGLSLQIVHAPVSHGLRAFLGVLTSVVAALGGLKEAAALFWQETGAGLALWDADNLALLAVHVAAGLILLTRFGAIELPRLRLIVRAFLIYLGVFTILGLAQLAAQNIPSSPPLLRDFPLEQLLYYLGFVVVALVMLARYFSEPSQGPRRDLAEEFVLRFGISAREREIIEMMAQGFSNNAIAEKLYISTVTVKNHVYHIYQKTGVSNKVQLLNMMNSLE